MRRVRKAPTAHQSAVAANAQVPLPIDDGTVMLSMIQSLIPVGLQAVAEASQRDVTALAGARYAHGDGTPGVARWGQQRGSIYLADQKVPITCRACAISTPARNSPWRPTPSCKHRARGTWGCFGACSQACPRASMKPLPKPCPRRSASPNRAYRAASFARVRMRSGSSTRGVTMIASGWSCCSMAKPSPTIKSSLRSASRQNGEKRVLGLVQTATENKRTCAMFVRDLVERGFTAPEGLLAVLDGAKGLRAAVRDVFGDDVAVQRCQWHERKMC